MSLVALIVLVLFVVLLFVLGIAAVVFFVLRDDRSKPTRE